MKDEDEVDAEEKCRLAEGICNVIGARFLSI
jgi:hypothetical protein